jgi:elongator complex protein 1
MLVAAPPGGVQLILQMPRGNLETIVPRFLALPAVAAALCTKRFGAAATLSAKHRIDLNLLVDYGWPNFLRHASDFVRDVVGLCRLTISNPY